MYRYRVALSIPIFAARPGIFKPCLLASILILLPKALFMNFFLDTRSQLCDTSFMHDVDSKICTIENTSKTEKATGQAQDGFRHSPCLHHANALCPVLSIKNAISPCAVRKTVSTIVLWHPRGLLYRNFFILSIPTILFTFVVSCTQLIFQE